MRITQVVPAMHDEASGPSYSVPRLARSLAELGHDVTLSCAAPGAYVAGVHLDTYIELPFLRQFSISPTSIPGLRGRARESDIVHNHSLWAFMNLVCGWVVPGHKARLVVSPRGSISEWAMDHSTTLKSAVWPIQKRALQKASLIHATAPSELADVRRLGFRNPVVLTPNGIDVPTAGPRHARERRTLLFLGRVHPKKGIDTLLRAWARLEQQHPQWDVKIVGTGPPEYLSELQRLTTELNLARVTFPGPVYGSDKDATFRDADLFVLPTHSENFGLAVAEALAVGCPAIVTHGAPWEGLERNRCGWWTRDSVDAVEDALADALGRPPTELVKMGERGRDWMQREFSWSTIGEQMAEAYEWAIHGGTPPDCVVTD